MKGLVVFASLLVPAVLAQEEQPLVQRSTLPVPLRSYAPPSIPAIRLSNSARLHTLMRAGKLYLSVADALALAIENNLNLEVDRYGPLLAQSSLERAKAGGALRGVPSASQQVASVNSGVGVNGSTLSAGLLSNGGNTNTGSSGGASIQQIGAVTPNLDPVLQSTLTVAHLTQPQSNLYVSGVPVLVQSVRTYNTVLQEGLISGGLVQFRDYEQYLKENSPFDYLNPAVGPHMDLYMSHNLLRGFGTKLNGRFIRVAQINTTASREVFRSQLLDLCAGVLNLYWDLVSTQDELNVRRQALQITQKFYADTQYEISVGAIAPVELRRAEAEVATRRQDVAISEDNVRQRAVLLKEAISHTEDPELEVAEIVPLDHIEVPETIDLPPAPELIRTALTKRPDVAVSKFRDQTDEISLIGTSNPLLPNLQVGVQTFDRGVAGKAPGTGTNSYFVGGYGTALGQIFRRNFPNNQAGVGISLPLHNRQAQGDYGIDQLQYRQSQLRSQRDTNQIAVDISSQVNALRQAHARYATARNTRILQEQLLEADQKRSSGIATFNTLMTDRRNLVAAQISETTALASYAQARVSLDQVLGETLERNHISLEEGLNGRVDRESRLPDVLQEIRTAPPQ